VPDAVNFTAKVEDSDFDYVNYGPYDDHVSFDRMWQGGGDASALRSYRAHHPAARIYDVTYRGRTVWMTLKQFAIWREALKYYKRGKRTTLDKIARTVGCSKSTVSRFLVRLDLWRFIDYISIVGRNGFTIIQTRRDVYSEWDANLSGARVTIASRKKARNLMAAMVKREIMRRLHPILQHIRGLHPYDDDPYPPSVFFDIPLMKLGRTGGTFDRIEW